MDTKELNDIHTAIKHTFPKKKSHVHYIGDLCSKTILPKCPSIFEHKNKEEWGGIYGYKLILEQMTESQRTETIGFILSLAIKNME